MIVQEQILLLLNNPETQLQLYPHQAVMMDEWEKRRTFLSETKTGTRKTIGAVMPIASSGILKNWMHDLLHRKEDNRRSTHALTR